MLIDVLKLTQTYLLLHISQKKKAEKEKKAKEAAAKAAAGGGGGGGAAGGQNEGENIKLNITHDMSLIII